MDVKFNSEVSSTTTTNNGVNSEIGEKEFTQSLNNPTNVTDVASVVQSQEEKATTDEPQSQIVDVDTEDVDQQVDSETVRELVGELNLTNVGLSFSVDEDTDRDLINVRDRDTDDLIRQIPSEEFLRVVKSIKNFKENAEGGAERSTLKGMILSDDA